MTHLDAWELVPMGDAGLLVLWRGPRELAPGAVHACRARLAALLEHEPIELVPGIDSVLVCFDPVQHDPLLLRTAVAGTLPTIDVAGTTAGSMVRIEVQYGGVDGLDLDWVAATCGLTPDDVVAMHTAQPMPVLMIGFMPGFPYIGGLPPSLHLPRRSEPRTIVPAGSVALANNQTGIYPAQSPGGWHLIGRTNARLFDPHRAPPSLLAPGDLVQFVAMPVD